MKSEQSLALQHVKSAESKISTAKQFRSKKPIEVHNCAVIGGGNMGTGIAYVLQNAGLGVQIVEVDDASADRAKVNVYKLIDAAVRRKLFDVTEGKIRKNNIEVISILFRTRFQ